MISKVRAGLVETNERKQEMLDILYEDKELIVVKKPVGIESQSSKGLASDMVSEIKKHIHNSSPMGGEPYVGVIHRLDKPVSGIIVYAKTKNAAAALSKQVTDGKMQKKYLAVVCGKPVDKVDKFVDYMLKDGKSNTSRIVDKWTNGGKLAELRFCVLESREIEPYGELSLLEVELLTGRHHQIRVQMAGHGMPLWGDNKYNIAFTGRGKTGGECKEQCEKERKHAGGRRGGRHRAEPVHVALSACELTFHHPSTGERMTFSRMPEGRIFQNFQCKMNRD